MINHWGYSRFFDGCCSCCCFCCRRRCVWPTMWLKIDTSVNSNIDGGFESCLLLMPLTWRFSKRANLWKLFGLILFYSAEELHFTIESNYIEHWCVFHAKWPLLNDNFQQVKQQRRIWHSSSPSVIHWWEAFKNTYTWLSLISIKCTYISFWSKNSFAKNESVNNKQWFERFGILTQLQLRILKPNQKCCTLKTKFIGCQFNRYRVKMQNNIVCVSLDN